MLTYNAIYGKWNGMEITRCIQYFVEQSLKKAGKFRKHGKVRCCGAGNCVDAQ